MHYAQSETPERASLRGFFSVSCPYCLGLTICVCNSQLHLP
nr:MAG TPA: Protein of unknown function (DUF1360) [Inoviridae sp.]